MRTYHNDVPPILFAPASAKIAVLAGAILILSALSWLVKAVLSAITNAAIMAALAQRVGWFSVVLLIVGAWTMVASIIVYRKTPAEAQIRRMVCRTLFCPTYGNPLGFHEGERLPPITCKSVLPGRYEVKITTLTVSTEDLQKISSVISAALNGKYERYAVTQIDTDIAFNHVTFTLDDVTIDRSLKIHSTEDLRPQDPTKLTVQQGTNIDLTASGSILVAGKTRSGKTTAVISLLMQVLLAGRDGYESEVIIIDPKRAELSRLPHVCTLDKGGEATAILAAIRHFSDTITMRQAVLNDLSEKCGDAVKWWNAGFHPSFLFVDEYVATRTIFPKKADKEEPEYCLATFDGLIKRIVTMGASAGCYVIISIAEASVEEGGLPSMLRSAMGTKILFKPTLSEARLLWGSEKLEALNATRIFGAGDAWLSSTDGINDNITFCHFPMMDFPVYRELGRLLTAYYGD